MTLSTSSSDMRINHSDPNDPRRVKERRKIALWTILFGGSALLAGLLVVIFAVSQLREAFPNPFSLQRIETSANALDSALRLPPDSDDTVVYVFGSSLIEFGFSPEIFDQRLSSKGIHTRSYNFGYGNADPIIHERFARRFEQIYKDTTGTVDLVIFEFSPFQATTTRAVQTGQLNHAAHAILGDWRDFIEVAKTDHEEAIALFNTRYIRNGVPAEAVTNLLATPLRNMQRIQSEANDNDAEPMGDMGWDLYHMLMSEWPQAHPPGGWYVENRGGLPPSASPKAMALAAEVMAKMQHPSRMEASRQQRLACCDMEDLNIDPAMLQHFIGAIKHAQKVAKRVDLLLMPRNQDIIHLSALGKANLKDALATIQHETGVNLVDLSIEPYFSVTDFFDADHLTLFKGRQKLSELLADVYAENGDVVK
ncbi:MAG: hypothetical protein P1U57_08890 [Oleibacter sp.]|nr:hypothetical protein [Thalassolituus sp.]